MKLEIYRLKEGGSIVRVIDMTKKNATNEEIKEAIEKYNNNSRHRDVVEVKEASELEIFMFEKGKFRIKEYRDQINEMIEGIDKLSCGIDWLYGMTKREIVNNVKSVSKEETIPLLKEAYSELVDIFMEENDLAKRIR